MGRSCVDGIKIPEITLENVRGERGVNLAGLVMLYSVCVYNIRFILYLYAYILGYSNVVYTRT